ncbi:MULTISPECIES: hypothetical protein [Nonomuraea]|uniref:hypothetical protein n=1 Tax=Nonomuraea TaxID=83681 RepID=UPI00066C2B46|nr:MULTISPECIES: hypothetical protein [Nonomuraea]
MYKTGLILAGLVGGMVMLGGGPALAEGYAMNTASVVAWPTHGDDDNNDNDIRAYGERNNFGEDNDDEVEGQWNNNGSDDDVLDLDILNQVLSDILTAKD